LVLFGNYAQAFGDTVFRQSLIRTLAYVFGTSLGLPVALGLALAINSMRSQRLKILASIIIFLPAMIPTVAGAVMWYWLMQEFGLINYVLGSLNLGIYPWLSSPNLAMPSIIISSVWKNIGFPTVMYIAALGGVPEIFHSAAKIDGAKRWQRFRHITWPLLAPTTLFVVIFGLINGFTSFAQIYAMTQGGPGKASTVLVYYIFESAFKFHDVGYASAMSVLLYMIIFALSLVQIRLIRAEYKI